MKSAGILYRVLFSQEHHPVEFTGNPVSMNIVRYRGEIAMKENHVKKISECIKCRNHIMQTSCAVVCSFFKDAYRELPMVLCDDPSQDYIEECPKLLRNARDTKLSMRYIPRSTPEKIAAPLMKQRYRGQLIKLFG